ncbi:hypothetical protein BDF19DRAFT_438689 [Syncephalis fuscata]|nr:hypothetical protein BDF19DRAFT_438689 [Syncephalis fuscata]
MPTPKKQPSKSKTTPRRRGRPPATKQDELPLTGPSIEVEDKSITEPATLTEQHLSVTTRRKRKLTITEHDETATQSTTLNTADKVIVTENEDPVPLKQSINSNRGCKRTKTIKAIQSIDKEIEKPVTVHGNEKGKEHGIQTRRQRRQSKEAIESQLIDSSVEHIINNEQQPSSKQVIDKEVITSGVKQSTKTIRKRGRQLTQDTVVEEEEEVVKDNNNNKSITSLVNNKRGRKQQSTTIDNSITNITISNEENDNNNNNNIDSINTDTVNNNKQNTFITAPIQSSVGIGPNYPILLPAPLPLSVWSPETYKEVDYFSRDLPVHSVQHTDPFRFRNLAHGIRKMSLYGSTEQRQAAMLAYKSIIETLATDIAEDDPEKETLKRIYAFLSWTFEPHAFKKEAGLPMPMLIDDDIKLLQVLLLQINAELHHTDMDVQRRQLYRQLNRVQLDPTTKRLVDLSRRKEDNFLPQVANPLGIYEQSKRKLDTSMTQTSHKSMETSTTALNQGTIELENNNLIKSDVDTDDDNNSDDSM